MGPNSDGTTTLFTLNSAPSTAHLRIRRRLPVVTRCFAPTPERSAAVQLGTNHVDPVDPIEGGCSNDYAYVYGDPVNAFDLDGQATLPACGGTNIKKGGARLTITEVARNQAAGWVEYNISFSAEGRYALKALYTTMSVYGRRPGARRRTRLAAIDSRVRDATRATSKPWYAHTTQQVKIGSELRFSGQIDYRTPWYSFDYTGVTLVGGCRA